MQVQTATSHSSKYRGVFGALRTIYQEEGVRGWYQGITPMIFSVGVFWSCYFPCYDYAKSSIASSSGSGADSSFVHISAAGLSGLLTDVVTNPLWVVRTRMATQALLAEQPLYRSMTHAFRKIARDEGVLAFFSGLRASLLGLSHIMIQFPLYERLKADFATSHDGLELRYVIAASATSKLIASTITYPHEVLRARLQFDQGHALYSGLGDVLREVLQKDGALGLWQGFSLNIVRTIPQCIVTFTLYETLSKQLMTLFERRRQLTK